MASLTAYRVDRLRLHPQAGLMPGLTRDEYEGLKNDIERRGVQVPICVHKEVVLCGQHRLRVARELGFETLDGISLPEMSAAEQIVHLVNDNLHRRQLSISQKAAIITQPRVAKALVQVLRAEGQARQLEAGARGVEGGRGRRKGTLEAGVPQGFARAPQTRDRLGAAAGCSGKMIDHALFAWKHAPARMKAIQAGSSEETVAQVANEIRRSEKATEAEKAIKLGVAEFESTFKLKLFDVWNFAALDPGFGQTWPGNIPASLVANAIYYFTEAGDLVVDPMAGGGVTLDVCRALGRRCISADLNPSRPEIIRHRIEAGPVKGTRGRAAFAFLDPPYWSQIDARRRDSRDKRPVRYAEDSASALPWPEWTAWLRKMAKSAASMVRPGGFVTVLMADSLSVGVDRFEAGRSSVFETMMAMSEAGLTMVTTISCPHSTQQTSAYDVEWARGEKRLLGINRLLLVFRKG